MKSAFSFFSTLNSVALKSRQTVICILECEYHHQHRDYPLPVVILNGVKLLFVCVL